ncbi:MAG: hypothetical protein ACRC8D_08525 [Aeromonas sp.]
MLTKCIDNLKSYYYDRSILKPLAELDVGDKRVTAGKRSNRSEAREAEVLVISAILHSMDLTSLLVGVPNERYGFIHKSTYELAKMAGLLDETTDEPHRRFTRTLSRIRRSGMMETTRTTFKSKEGAIRAGVAIKRVSEEFILMLMGGTPKDKKALEKTRATHYAKTRAKRVKSKVDVDADYRSGLEAKMMAKSASIKEHEAAKRLAKEVGEVAPAYDAFSPEARQQAYQKAKQQHQNSLLASGADFQQINQAMRAFPSIENWNGGHMSA